MTKEDPSSEPIMIREVWAHNLQEEFNLIRGFVGTYNFISMDTEFPGVIFPLKVDHRHLQPYEQYSYLKSNVDALKIIQIGLTLTDAKGNIPRFKNICCIWEFNFCDFKIGRDIHNQDSIDMLRRQGIDFTCKRLSWCEFIPFLSSDVGIWTTLQQRCYMGHISQCI